MLTALIILCTVRLESEISGTKNACSTSIYCFLYCTNCPSCRLCYRDCTLPAGTWNIRGIKYRRFTHPSTPHFPLLSTHVGGSGECKEREREREFNITHWHQLPWWLIIFFQMEHSENTMYAEDGHSITFIYILETLTVERQGLDSLSALQI